jgi:hypothetical protein
MQNASYLMAITIFSRTFGDECGKWMWCETKRKRVLWCNVMMVRAHSMMVPKLMANRALNSLRRGRLRVVAGLRETTASSVARPIAAAVVYIPRFDVNLCSLCIVVVGHKHKISELITYFECLK